MVDLWPEKIEMDSGITTPYGILKEQAALLGQKTRNLVEAQVVKRTSLMGPEFEYAFYLVAPLLANYRYLLFSISHGLTLYPVTIDVDGDIAAQLGAKTSSQMVVASEEHFIEMLRRILASDRTQQIIRAIFAQSEVEVGPRGETRTETPDE